jgi:REP element-mobilizing transposase RayT
MTTIYLMVNGISTQILNTKDFQLFNWFNFKAGDNVFVNGEFFAKFVGYEKSEMFGDEIVKLELNS